MDDVKGGLKQVAAREFPGEAFLMKVEQTISKVG